MRELRNRATNISTRSQASSTLWHDQRYSEESRTCAMPLKRPMETNRLIESQHISQRHCPLPAPLGYICRQAPSKVKGRGMGSSAMIAACFQASSCSLSSSGIVCLYG